MDKYQALLNAIESAARAEHLGIARDKDGAWYLVMISPDRTELMAVARIMDIPLISANVAQDATDVLMRGTAEDKHTSDDWLDPDNLAKLRTMHQRGEALN